MLRGVGKLDRERPVRVRAARGLALLRTPLNDDPLSSLEVRLAAALELLADLRAESVLVQPERSFRVIDGLGREQAVMWSNEPTYRPCPVSDEMLAAYRGLRFADVFGTGIPDWFRPGAEDSVVEEAVAAVTER